MDDLISRKALCDYALNQKDKSVTPNDIMRFPSAQPEPNLCKAVNTIFHDSYEYTRQYRAFRKEMEAKDGTD